MSRFFRPNHFHRHYYHKNNNNIKPAPRYCIENGPFDMYKFTNDFPNSVEFECNDYNEAVLARAKELEPTECEIGLLCDRVKRVTDVLEAMAASPKSFEPAVIEEIRIAGAFKTSTLLVKSPVAEIVIVLKTLPTTLSVSLLANHIALLLQQDKVDDTVDPMVSITDRGMDIYFNPEKICILVATIAPNMKYIDNKIHLKLKHIQQHILKLRYTKWFEDNAKSRVGVRSVVRLLTDLKNRSDGLAALSEWMILFLCIHSCSTNIKDETQMVPMAFRRAMQLLSSGFYLPSSNSVMDPCSSTKLPMYAHVKTSLQDKIAGTGQTLFRVLGNGGYKEVLGTTTTYKGAEQLAVVHGIVVAASECLVQPKPEDGETGGAQLN